MAGKGRVYRISPLAEADLEDIWQYTLERWSLDHAETYHAAIVSTFEDLATGVKHGRPVSVREDTSNTWLDRIWSSIATQILE